MSTLNLNFFSKILIIILNWLNCEILIRGNSPVFPHKYISTFLTQYKTSLHFLNLVNENKAYKRINSYWFLMFKTKL